MNTFSFRFVLSIILLITGFISSVNGQLFPQNRSVLNYTLVPFSVPSQDNVSEYQLEIWKYDINKKGEVSEKSVFKKKSKDNTVTVLLPYWDQVYTWQVKYYSGDKVLGSTEKGRFATGISPFIDSTQFRLRIIKNDIKEEDGYVFIDGLKGLFGLNGKPIWYLPDVEGAMDVNARIRDLKPTIDNTITFLTDNNAYEIDFNGNVLWKAPNDGQVSQDTTEGYHHQFDKLANGHYMVAGNNTTLRQITGITDTTLYKNETDIIKEGEIFYKKISAGTLIEYDEKGKVVWYWKVSDHFSNADFFTRKSPSGTVNTHTHMNCFFYDSVNSKVYIGFRDINRIVEIDYPSGKVLAQYGEDYTNNNSVQNVSSFKAHHNNIITGNGEIMLFNNNLNARQTGQSEINTASTIIRYKKEKKSLVKVWEFPLDVDTLALPYTFAGGSVEELENNRILSSMGSMNRNIIVTDQKKLIWNSLSEKYDKEKKLWVPQSSYKASFISKEKYINSIILIRNK